MKRFNKARERRLKSEARDAATFRHHKMKRSWIKSWNRGEWMQSLPCNLCGMHVIIDLEPGPQDLDRDPFGDAVSRECPGKED